MLNQKNNLKKFLSLVTIVLTFSSFEALAQDDVVDSKVWILTKMNTGRTNVQTTGTELAWQEDIVLHFDGTFTKTVGKEGKYTDAKGKFEYQEESDGKYLKLTYDSKNDLITSCTSDLVELLKIISDTEIQGTAMACDKPMLTYQLSE